MVRTAGILVHGTGMELNETVCVLGIVNCIVFYTTSKMLIYIFLGKSVSAEVCERLADRLLYDAAEKVHVVWGGRKGRLRSKVYLVRLLLLLISVGVVVFLIFGTGFRRSRFARPSHNCTQDVSPTSAPAMELVLLV